MNVAIRQSGSVTILDLQGQLTKGTDLENAANQQLSGGKREILLHMGGLTFINSSGITGLNRVKQTATRMGAAVKLVQVNDKVLQALKLAGTDAAFEIYQDETTAVRSFK